MKLLLSMKEAQKYLGLGRKKILYYVNEGYLPFINSSEGELLPRYMFRKKSLDDLIEKLETCIHC